MKVSVAVCLFVFLFVLSSGREVVEFQSFDEDSSKKNGEDNEVLDEETMSNDRSSIDSTTGQIETDIDNTIGHLEDSETDIDDTDSREKEDSTLSETQSVDMAESSDQGADPVTSPIEVNKEGRKEITPVEPLLSEDSPPLESEEMSIDTEPERTPADFNMGGEMSNEPDVTPADFNKPIVAGEIPEGAPIDNEDKENEESVKEVLPGTEQYNKGAELIANLYFEDKARGYEMLKEAASLGNWNALELLAYGYLYGNILQRNFSKSLEIFTELADKGYASGQQGLGLLHSTGIQVNSSQAKAVLYYTFAGLGGHSNAQMAMGYRSYLGVGVPQSCEISLSYYSKVAATVADTASVFAGGHAVQKARLTDDDESSTVFAGVTEDELEHYREVFADTGAQFSLGLYYLFGLGGVERNLPQALDLLRRADTPAALALIGRIYAEGSPPDILQNNSTAISYFNKAIELKSPEGYAGLGIMYFKGMGVERDYRTALELFQKASDKGSQEANLYIGLANLFALGVPVNPTKALSNFKSSAQSGHVLALYYMAEIYARGLNGRKSCKQAVELYKAVAERGKWSRLLREAHKTYMSGDIDSALMMYLHLGELGIEVAQSNAAFILHEDSNNLLAKNESLKRALMLWSRSATQGYSVARVMLGDYYYYGYGTEQDMELAVDQYRLASDKLSNPQAMFNLGYMYENGIGLQQDYHLAKRYYDKATGTTADAALPVYFALLKLSAVSYWQILTEQVSVHDELQNITSTLWSMLDEWDIYLIAILCVVLAIVVRWHRR